MSIFDEAAPGNRRLTPRQLRRKRERDRRWNAARQLRDAMGPETRAAEERRLAAEIEAVLAERRNA